jgi:beta-phosphoglucomutase-like phosphatase (HAD superfamily)
MLRAVLFDLHGTLLDDGALRLRLCTEVAAEQGLALTEELFYGKLAGLDDRALFTALARETERALQPDELRRLSAALAQRYEAALQARAPLFPGTVEIVKECARQVPLGLLADGPRAHASLVLKGAGLFDRFTAILGAEQVHRRRPDPSGHVAALHELNRDLLRHGKQPLSPRHVLCVEDDEAGVAAAKGAGLKVVALGHTTPQHRLERADAFLARLLDLSLDALSRELF